MLDRKSGNSTTGTANPSTEGSGQATPDTPGDPGASGSGGRGGDATEN